MAGKMRRQEALDGVLGSLLEETGVSATVLLNNRGQLLAHRMPSGWDKETVGAMAAILGGSGAKVAGALGLGLSRMAILDCERGELLVVVFGDLMLAAILAPENVNLALATIGMRRAVEGIQAILDLRPLDLKIDRQQVADVVREIRESDFGRSILDQLGGKG